MRTCNNILFAGLVIALAAPGPLVAQRSGAEVWGQVCGNCHRIQPPQRYTADKWASIMTHMTIQARLTTEEADAVLEFLQAGAHRMASVAPKESQPVLLASADPGFYPSLGIDGEQLYERQCRVCHGAGGTGDGPAASAMRPPPANLTKLVESRVTDAELESIVSTGRGNMPSFMSILTQEEIRAVVQYVRTLGSR